MVTPENCDFFVANNIPSRKTITKPRKKSVDERNRKYYLKKRFGNNFFFAINHVSMKNRSLTTIK